MSSIAYDSASSQYFGTAATSHTLSHTCSGGDRVLVVSTYSYDANAVTGVTYNGVSMSAVGTRMIGSDGMKTWILVAPASGANNIVVSLSSSRRCQIFAISLTGAKQSGQPDASADAAVSGTSATSSVTTVANNSWSVMAYTVSGAGDPSGTHTNWTPASTIASRGSIGYGGPKTPAGSFTQTISLDGSSTGAVMQVSISPSSRTSFFIFFN